MRNSLTILANLRSYGRPQPLCIAAAKILRVDVAGCKITKYGIELSVITLIGLFLRVYQLCSQSIWADEGWIHL